MNVLQLIFLLVIVMLVLSLAIEAIPSIIKIVLICIAIGLVLHFAGVVLIRM